jgi:hypothetical protein
MQFLSGLRRTDMPHEVTVIKGRRFPTCRHCKGIRFRARACRGQRAFSGLFDAGSYRELLQDAPAILGAPFGDQLGHDGKQRQPEEQCRFGRAG